MSDMLRGVGIPFALCAVSLTIGVFVGVGVAGRMVPETSAGQDEADARRGMIADSGEQASLAALRARVRELEQRLAATRTDARPADARGGEMARTDGETSRNAPARPRAWLEEMRKSDPKRFAQMTNRMAQFRAAQLNRTVSRIERLSSIDTTNWADGAKDAHARYMELIARREELIEQLHAEMGQPSDEGARKAFLTDLREVSEQLRGLEREERENLLRETARSFGLGEEDAGELAETVRGVIDVTSDYGGRGPHGGHHGGPHSGPRGGSQ